MEITTKEQLKELLLSSENTISIEEARKELNEKWLSDYCYTLKEEILKDLTVIKHNSSKRD